MKLILLRHGESKWNLENRFTGWKDVSLTNKGKDEAAYSGHKLNDKNIEILVFILLYLIEQLKPLKLLQKS